MRVNHQHNWAPWGGEKEQAEFLDTGFVYVYCTVCKKPARFTPETWQAIQERERQAWAAARSAPPTS